ncbi:hypothetical protein K466DRAFT_658909 [Polyporus arcularius HHB13444]|uniref:F-box domain-containing protein n=1 Tax=Polyporus arcularius HHB13444 TaxID=1314778 RepID=A0A5C3PWM9_9APHY|nr:hypothetical protein K466DRAFT_658909 [Polyporus arcularius HHB13444]
MGNDVSIPHVKNDSLVVVQDAHHALFEYDVLSLIFYVFDLEDKENRRTCARSARVCRAWTEPASRALWSRTRWKLQDLCTVLLKHTIPAGSRGLKHTQVKAGHLRHDHVQRESLLRCAARVRQLCISQRLQPARLDVQLLRRVLSISNGTTFLPALLSLSWVEGPRTEGLLLRLIPPSVQELELIFDWETSPKQVHRLLTGLSHPALSLRSVRIYAWKPEQFSLDPLLNLTSIQELSLEGSIVLGPEELCKVLSSLALVSIEVTVRDFKTRDKVINGGSLKELHCAGTCADITALVKSLLAPSLKTADLKLDIVDAHFDRTGQRHLCQTLLKFSPSLRSLQLDYRKVYTNSELASASHLPPIPLVSDVLKPLFGRLYLESFTLCSELRVLLTDDQIMQVAQGWPMLRSLSLMNHPCQPANIATPAALVYLAKHCPNLRFLRIQLSAREFVPPSPESSLELRALQHPLRTLRQVNGYDACRTSWRMAEFLDDLFPYLAVEACEEVSTNVIVEGGCSWGMMWGALRAMKTARYAEKEPRDYDSPGATE